MAERGVTVNMFGVSRPERPRLLVVDDQPVNIQVLYQIFGQDSEVFMATSGNEALDVCQQQMPDLILLDVVMPDMDGLEVCRKLKENEETRDIPVIFVTSQNSPEEETEGLEAGAVDFISKPLNPAVVKARVATHLTLKAQADTLKRLAFVDGLTGVANRRLFDERLDIEWRACLRNQKPLALVMLDVDHFKKYNDYYGHQMGDVCLKQVAAALSNAIGRPRDLVARYGGEEFVCLLPETDRAGAIQTAENLRQSVEGLALEHQTSTISEFVTVSLGGAVVIPDRDLEARELIAAADASLYEAKLTGRNRVCFEDTRPEDAHC